MITYIVHWLEYLLTLVVSIVLLVFFHNYYTFFLLVFLIFFPVVSIGSAWFVSKKVLVQIETSKKSVLQNVECLVYVTVKNPTCIPMLNCFVHLFSKNHFLEPKESIEMKIPAIALRENTVSFPIQSCLNGAIEIKSTKLVLYDMLRLVSFQKTLELSNNISVLPSTNEKYSLTLNTKENGNEEKDPSIGTCAANNPIGIREYREGDPLKQIHWKLSSKCDQLLVKEYDSDVKTSICILIELQPVYELSFLLDALYAIGQQYVTKACVVEVYWWSEREHSMHTEIITTPNELHLFFLRLYQEDTYQQPDLGLQQFGSMATGLTSFYYITPEQKEEGRVHIAYMEP